MSYTNTITPVAGWPTVPTPADGDSVDPTDHEEVAQALADRDQLLYIRLFPTEICLPLIGHPMNGVAEYDYTAAAGVAAFESQTNNANEYLDLELGALPDGTTMTAVRVGIEGTGGYAGTPAVVNQFELMARSHSTGVVNTYGAPATDPATFGGTPEMTDYREIAMTGLSQGVGTYLSVYFLRFTHESGANALAGVQIQSIEVTLTRPTS